MIDMERPDTDDNRSNYLLLKKRILKHDVLYRQHAQLQTDYEALIKEYKLIEDKKKETDKQLQKYVRGCTRLLKENECLKKEIVKLKETDEEKSDSMEKLRLDYERLNGALTIFQDQRKHLHEASNCTFRNDRASLIKLCHDIFKNRLKTEKMSNLYKNFHKKYEEDLNDLKLRVLKIEKLQKGKNVKPEECDSDLDESLNDFSDEVQPIDSVESGYHENDSIIESIQSKSDGKLDQDFEIREGISLNESLNERWLDPTTKVTEIILDNQVNMSDSCENSVVNVMEEVRAITNGSISPPTAIIPNNFSFSPKTSPSKVEINLDTNLQLSNSIEVLNRDLISYSLYISPLKEKLEDKSEAIEKTLQMENAPKLQVSLPATRTLSFSPESSPVKAITVSSNNLRTYEKRKKKETEKIHEESSNLEILGRQIEKNIVEGIEAEDNEKEIVIDVGEKDVEIETEMAVEEEGNLIEIEEKEVEEVEKLVEVEDEEKKKEEEKKMEEEEKQTEMKEKMAEEKQIEVGEKMAEEKQIEVGEKMAEEKQIEVGEKMAEEKQIEVGEKMAEEKQIEVGEKMAKEKQVEEKENIEGEKQIEVGGKQMEEKDKQMEIGEKQVEENETTDADILKMFEEMRMPTLISPIKSTPKLLKSKIEKRKKENKNKKVKKKKKDFEKVIEDKVEWRDALFAVLSLKKKDKTAKAILDVLKKSREKTIKRKKAKKKQKSSWAVEDLQEDNLTAEASNIRTEIDQIGFSQEVFDKPRNEKKSEGSSEKLENLLNEISTQTEVETSLPELPGNCVEEFLERQEPENSSNKISTHTENKPSSPKLPENCLNEISRSKESEYVENFFDKCSPKISIDLSEKNEKNSANFEQEDEVQTENSGNSFNEDLQVVLDLSQKNSSAEITDNANFSNSSLIESEMDLQESSKSPVNNFVENISENEELENFLQNAVETCLTESPESPPVFEKSLLETSHNFVKDSSENENFAVLEEPVKCLTESLESPSESHEDSPQEQSTNQPCENLFSENSSSYDSEENCLQIVSDELNENSSVVSISPLSSIESNFKLVSPIRVHNYQLRSSRSPCTPPEPPFPRIKFIDTSPFNTYDLTFRDYHLNNCDISDSHSELPDNNSPEYSPIKRGTRQRQPRKRKRRLIDDSSDSSSDAETEDPKRKCLSALIQEREDKESRSLMESSPSKIPVSEEPEISVISSPIATLGSREFTSKVELNSPAEIPEFRKERTLAEKRESVLRATKDSNIFENSKCYSSSNRKRRRTANSDPVEICKTCLGPCFNKCKRKLIVTNEVQKRILRNMTHKDSKTTFNNELKIDIAPEVAMSSESDNEHKNQALEKLPNEENGFALDSVLLGMTKQKEEFKAPPRRIFVPCFIQAPVMPVIQAPATFEQEVPKDNIDWRSVYDKMNFENVNPMPDERVIMDDKEILPEKKTPSKLKFQGKQLDDFVKKKLERFVNSNMETNEEAEKNTKECISYLLNVPEDTIAKETVALILENVDEAVIIFEKPTPPLTKTQQRLLIILSLLQKTSGEYQNLNSSILKLINQKLFPETFFWPDDSLESASRFYAALCRNENNFKAIWKFCLTALSEMHQRFSIVIHTVLLVWPDILHEAEIIKSNLLTNTFVQLILETPKSEGRRKELQMQQRKLLALKELLRRFYNFNVNTTLDSYLKDLFNEFLKGTEKSEESLTLFVKCKTFEWLGTHFVPKVLEYVNSWEERKIGNYIGIKALNFLKLMSNKVPVAKNLNAKVSKMFTRLLEILSSGKMSHDEEEEIVEVLISFPKYVKLGDVLSKWNVKSLMSQNLQGKIAKALEKETKANKKPVNRKQPQKPKPKVKRNNVNSGNGLYGAKKKKQGGKKYKKKKKSEISENKQINN